MQCFKNTRKTLALHSESIVASSIMLLVVAIIMFIIYRLGFASHEIAITSEEGPGFFMGFWHGLISLVALIASLFSDDVAMYATANKGFSYSLGFWIGVGGFLRFIKI